MWVCCEGCFCELRLLAWTVVVRVEVCSIFPFACAVFPLLESHFFSYPILGHCCHLMRTWQVKESGTEWCLLHPVSAFCKTLIMEFWRIPQALTLCLHLNCIQMLLMMFLIFQDGFLFFHTVGTTLLWNSTIWRGQIIRRNNHYIVKPVVQFITWTN